MSDEIGQIGPEHWEPVQTRIKAVAERLTVKAPDAPADMRKILDVAQAVSADAEAMVLAGMIALILSPYDGETNTEYAARLREAVAG